MQSFRVRLSQTGVSTGQGNTAGSSVNKKNVFLLF